MGIREMGSKKWDPKNGIQKMGFKNFEKKIWKIVPGVKCHPGVFRASNATRGYWGVKCHPGYWGVKCHTEFTGASKARGVKGPNSLMASKIRGVKGPYMGKGRKGHKASEFRESKFGRQGSRRQRSRASKEMNPSKVNQGHRSSWNKRSSIKFLVIKT